MASFDSEAPLANKTSSQLQGVKYLDKRIIWRLHIEIIEAKTFRTFITIYPVFRSERLSTNIKLTLHRAPSVSAMTYAWPAWEFATETIC
jgi:hypothetical protein